MSIFSVLNSTVRLSTAPTTSTVMTMPAEIRMFLMRICRVVIGFLLRRITSLSCLRITLARFSRRFFSLYSSI